MTEEIMTLRALFNTLAAKPNPVKLHKFFERVVTRIEEQDREIMDLKRRISVFDDPTTREPIPQVEAGPVQVMSDHPALAVEA